MLSAFTRILTGLKATLGAIAPKAPPEVGAQLTLVWHRIALAARRIERLYTQWQAGTLKDPKPRPPQKRGARKPYIRLPQRKAWLFRTYTTQIVPSCSYLQQLMEKPEMAEFLTAVPRARRSLKPLCRMLGVTFPDETPQGIFATKAPAPTPKNRPDSAGSTPPDPPPLGAFFSSA